MQKKQRHKERASQRMFPRGPVSFQRLYRRSAGITQARFELAFDREHPEKTALEMPVCRVHSGKWPLSTTRWVFVNEARSVFPSFAHYLIRVGLSGGHNRRRVRLGHLTIIVGAGISMPDPGVASLAVSGIAGQVSRQAVCDPGQAVKHKQSLSLPVKRKTACA